MDILDIVKSHLKERELHVEIKIQEIIDKLNNGETIEQLANNYNVKSNIIKTYLKEDYRFDSNTKKWIKRTQQEEVEIKETSLEQIATVPYKLFTGTNMPAITEKLNITTAELKHLLNKYNYKKRWRYTGKGNKTSIKPEILNIINLLNGRKYNLHEVSENLKIDVEDLKISLKKAEFQKVWTLESNVSTSEIETNIEGFRIIRDLETGILEYIVNNGLRYYTSSQVNSKLSINSDHYFNHYSKKFIQNTHFIDIGAVLNKKIIQAIPSLYLFNFNRLYSEKGMDLLAELSNRKVNDNLASEISNDETGTKTEQYNFNKITQIAEINNANKPSKVSIDQQTSTTKHYSSFFESWIEEEEIVMIKNIVYRLNNGETLYDISKEFVANRKFYAAFSTKLQLRLEDEGYSYSKASKKWTHVNKGNKNNIIAQEKRGNFSALNNYVEENTTNNEIEINDIVTFLNKEGSFKKAEEKFGIKPIELRLLLKNKGYKYNVLLKLWSQKDKETLIKEISEDLNGGVQTLSDLEKKGVDTAALTKEIKIYQNVDEQLIVSLPNKKLEIENNNEDKKNMDSTDFSPSTFNAEEIDILRKIIAKWQINKEKETLNENQFLEVTFRLDHQLIEQIDNYSEVNRISKSMVLEKALRAFFHFNNKDDNKN